LGVAQPDLSRDYVAARPAFLSGNKEKSLGISPTLEHEGCTFAIERPAQENAPIPREEEAGSFRFAAPPAVHETLNGRQW
jgi:hypothetical protein